MNSRILVYALALSIITLTSCGEEFIDFDYPYDPDKIVVYAAIENTNLLRFEAYQLLDIEQISERPRTLDVQVVVIEDSHPVDTLNFNDQVRSLEFSFQLERTYSLHIIGHENIIFPEKSPRNPVEVELKVVDSDTDRIFIEYEINGQINDPIQDLIFYNHNEDSSWIRRDRDYLYSYSSDYDVRQYSSIQYINLYDFPFIEQIWDSVSIQVWVQDEDIQEFWYSVYFNDPEFGLISGVQQPPSSNLNGDHVIGFFGAVSGIQQTVVNPLCTCK